MATIAPPNSFLVPQQAVQSGLSAYRPSQFGVMQPYVSDLLTAQPGANKYMGATYVGDPTKIQERLNQYSNISGRDLEGLRDYLSPLALQSSKFTNNMVFKKPELEKALGNLTGLDTSASQEWSPLLQGIDSVGSYGGQSLYEADKLKDHLSNLLNTYSPIDAAEAQSLFQKTNRSLDPIGSLYGKQFYDKSKLGEIYDLVPDAGTNVNGVKVLGGSLNAWMNPSGSYFDPRPVKQGGYYYGDPWGFSHEVQRVKGTPYYFIPESNFEPTRSGTASTWYSPASTEGLYSYDYNGKRGLVFDPSKTELKWNTGRINDMYAEKKGGGIFGDNFISDILDNSIVNTALSVIPVTAPYMAAYNAANALYKDDIKGALLSAAGGVMSAYGFNPATELGKGANKALELGLGKAGQMALGGGLYGAGMGALRGGDLKSALTGAVTGGLGGYTGATVADFTKGMSPLAQYAANIGTRTGMGGLGALLSGRNAKQGALGGLASGVGGALSGVIGQNYGKPFGAISNPVIQQMLANQLYKV